MTNKRISFDQGTQVDAAAISRHEDILKTLEELEISYPKTVIVLVGGAGGIDIQDQPSVQKAISIVAKLAEETSSAIIDGGTQFGVMLEIGRQRKQNNYSFPLIGTLPVGKFTQKEPQAILEHNHTHFILAPGDQWGDESIWIAKIGTILSRNKKSITILINGGEVSKIDIKCSLMENRTTIIIRGTGRLADEIPLSDNMFEVDISKNNEEIPAFLRSKLL